MTDKQPVSGDAMAMAWQVGANSKNKQIAELVAEVERLRGIIEDMECSRPVTSNTDLRNGKTGILQLREYDCIEYAALTGNPRAWCSVCKAKEALHANKP